MSVTTSSTNNFYVFINGHAFTETSADPEWTLLFYLRRKLKLPGTKLGCGEGACGACTVMVSHMDRKGIIRHMSMNACLTPVVCLHGMAVTTVEGVGSMKTSLHPIQEKLALAHGSQCGFCTPGFVMSMYALLRTNPEPSMQEIEENLFGNLCRCTGYRPILEGFGEFAGCGAKDCCQLQPNSSERCTKTESSRELVQRTTQDVIFPPELKGRSIWQEQCLVIKGPRVTWLQPSSLKDLLELKSRYRNGKIVAGGTIIGIEAKHMDAPYAVQIQTARVPEMNSIDETADGVKIGATLRLLDVESTLKRIVKTLPADKTKVLVAFLEMLKWFASKQIKSVASLGGNVMAASSVSSLTHILLASGAKLHVQSIDNKRDISMNVDFYDANTKKTALEEDEILVSVTLPYTNQAEFFDVFRQAKRRTNDTPIVIAAMSVTFDPTTRVVEQLQIAVGGMTKTPMMASKTSKAMTGRKWDTALLEEASSLLMTDFDLAPNAPGGSVHYKKTLLLSFFLKFHVRVRQYLASQSDAANDYVISENEKSILTSPEKPPIKTTQLYDKNAHGPDAGPVGKPLMHTSGYKHTTGEAVYVDDMPHMEDELHGVPILSTRAKAFIETIDASVALKMEGIKHFYSAKDVHDSRKFIGCSGDEEIFASKEVQYAGQIVGVLLATSKELAKRAVKKIRITYKDPIQPATLTIEEAIAANSFYNRYEVTKGDIEKGFEQADEVIEGEHRVGAQEHLYMETQGCIVIPQEDGGMIVYSSTQDPCHVQMIVAKVLGVPASHVISKVKRAGGGFGGKVSNAASLAAVAAIASSKCGKSVRMTLDRDVDMLMTGKSHSDHGQWKVGFKKNGTITALHLQMHSNGGALKDLSDIVAVKVLLHADSGYAFEHMKASMQVCKTNLPPGISLRALGTPHSASIMESVIDQVSAHLNLPPTMVRELNMYPEENPTTYFGQVLQHCSIRRCWQQVLLQSQYQERQVEVDKFNRENKYNKRGLAAIPCKQGVCFSYKPLSQAGALVHIYLDGSVLLTHGGAEVGQGIQVKMIQIAARVLGIPPERIYTTDHSTDKVPNTSPTAGSTGSDLNGMAVLEACQILNNRLDAFRTANPSAGWSAWVGEAYANQVSLSAAGYYKDPHVVEYDFKNQTGNPYTYFAYGAGVCEAEIDVLTGDHHVRRVDLVVDAGDSLNPAIDIGQIEGAFVQAYGNFTTEELLFSQEGSPRTQGLYNYKIPSVNDIPREFNVSLLRDSPNPLAIYSSRGIGEAPMTLGISAFMAIKAAIGVARGSTEFRLDAPATSERIRMACQDQIVHKTAAPNGTSVKPWSVEF